MSLSIKVVRLLQPEAVISQRLPDASVLSRLIKSVADAVSAHAASLPAQVDVVLVARASGTRVWLIGPDGDVDVPGLASAIDKLPAAPVKSRQVAAIVTLARDGVTLDAKRVPKLPSAWSAAAAPGGSAIDDVIDAVWPR